MTISRTLSTRVKNSQRFSRRPDRVELSSELTGYLRARGAGYVITGRGSPYRRRWLRDRAALPAATRERLMAQSSLLHSAKLASAEECLLRESDVLRECGWHQCGRNARARAGDRQKAPARQPTMGADPPS